MIETVLAVAASPWVVPLLFVLCTVDGFLPPVPSESVLIALATLSATAAIPPVPVPVLVAVGALGAFAGDQIAYRLGARVPLQRWPWFRGPRGQRRFDRVRTTLRSRGMALILAARHVPVLRVVVTMTAGATGYPRSRFLLATAVASPAWAAYCVLIGIGAGTVLPMSPLAAVVVGVVTGALLGTLADQVAQRVRIRRAEPDPAGADTE